MLCCATACMAQTAADYTVSRSTAISYSSISGTGSSFASWRESGADDNRSQSVDIGFTFYYMGQPVTQFSISTNGFIDFSSSSATGAGSGAYGYMNSNFSSPGGTTLAIAPFYTDLIGASTSASYAYLTSGTAPNRILTAEWIGVRGYNDGGGNLNFQVRLHEKSNAIDMIYGGMTSGGMGYSYVTGINNATISSTPQDPELAVQQAANTNQFSPTPATLSALPNSSSMLTFTPPVVQPAAAKYFGGSYDGYTGMKSAPANCNGIAPDFSKFFGGSFDGYSFKTGAPSTSGGEPLALGKYFGGGHDGTSAMMSAPTNCSGVAMALAKYFGGSYDGSGLNSILLTNTLGAELLVTKYYGGGYDGYDDIPSPRTSLGNGVVADMKFFGGKDDGYTSGSGGMLPLFLTGARYLGGILDGYAQGPSLLGNAAGATIQLGKYFGGMHDGYTFSLSLENSPLPIQLSSFTGRYVASSGGILLEWSTLGEVDCYGYYVERRKEPAMEFGALSDNFVAGQGSTLEEHRYSFIDNTIDDPGVYDYRLKQVDLDGSAHYNAPISIRVSVLSVKEAAPVEFRVYQNYPNPFNPASTLTFTVEKQGPAKVLVFNILGQEVLRLFDGEAEPGRYYRLTIDGSRLGSGMYFYRVTTANHSAVRRMLLVK